LEAPRHGEIEQATMSLMSQIFFMIPILKGENKCTLPVSRLFDVELDTILS
jgi:hypothetical protein